VLATPLITMIVAMEENQLKWTFSWKITLF